jgi:hypothetical protein
VVKYWRTNMNNIKSLQAHKEPVRCCARARALPTPGASA